MTLSTGPRAPGARRAAGHRRPGRRTGRRGRRPTPGPPLTRLRVDGGLTQSRVLMQATADLVAGAGRRLPLAHATALGAAALAGWPATRTRRWGTSVTAWRPRPTYEPQWSADRADEFRSRVATISPPRRYAVAGDPVTDLATYDVAVIGAGIVGSAIARELAGYDLSVAAGRGPRRRRRRHQQGQHRDPAHRIRRQARHPGVPTGPPRLPAAGRLRQAAPASRSSAPARILVAWDRRAARRAARTAGQGRGQRLPRVRTRRRRRGLRRRCPHLGDGCARRADRAGRVDHLHLDDQPRAGHRRRQPGRRAAAPACASKRSTSATESTTAAHRRAGDVTRPLGRQRRRARRRPDRRAVRPRPVHRHPAPRRAARLRQAGPAAGRQDRAAGADSPRQGRAGQPDDLRQRDARPDRRGPADRTATGTSEAGFDFLLEKGARARCRACSTRRSPRPTPACARPSTTATTSSRPTPAQRYLLVGGIRSTGLTAGMAIAEHVRDLLRARRARAAAEDRLPDPPRMPNLGEAFPRPYQDAARIARRPAYGRIVCFCERVTAGEIRDACLSPIPPPGSTGCAAAPGP